MDDDALAGLARGSIEASCAPADTRKRINAEIDAWLNPPPVPRQGG
jgi:adenosine deaminase